MILRQGYNSAGLAQPNVSDLTTYSPTNDIMQYTNAGCYQNIDTSNVRRLSIDNINQPEWNTSPSEYRLNGSLSTGEIKQINTKIISPSSNDANSIVSQDVKLYVPRVYMGRDP